MNYNEIIKIQRLMHKSPSSMQDSYVATRLKRKTHMPMFVGWVNSWIPVSSVTRKVSEPWGCWKPTSSLVLQRKNPLEQRSWLRARGRAVAGWRLWLLWLGHPAYVAFSCLFWVTPSGRSQWLHSAETYPGWQESPRGKEQGWHELCLK